MNQYFVTKVIECGNCDGGGVKTRFEHDRDFGKSYPVDYDCPTCNGTGKTTQQVSLEGTLIALGVLKIDGGA